MSKPQKLLLTNFLSPGDVVMLTAAVRDLTVAPFGVNVFVLDLPLSVGIEYGLSAFWLLGDKTKVEVETPSESYEYFTVSNDQAPAHNGYSDVKQKYMTMNSNDQVRITANIYFN